MRDAKALKLLLLNSLSLEYVEQRHNIEIRVWEEHSKSRKRDSGSKQFEMIAITIALYEKYSAPKGAVVEVSVCISPTRCG